MIEVLKTLMLLYAVGVISLLILFALGRLGIYEERRTCI